MRRGRSVKFTKNNAEFDYPPLRGHSRVTGLIWPSLFQSPVPSEESALRAQPDQFYLA